MIQQLNSTITVRRAQERGFFNHGWLQTYHTFSFADYFDPGFMGFRSLRVINEDRVAPGSGFPTHPHRDMEILTYVLQGALEHKDSMGHGSVIVAGDVQRMTAGTGVTHSEFNASSVEPVHFLQIWIVPEQKQLRPGYEQRHVALGDRPGQFHLIGSRSGSGSSVTIHQDVNVYAVVAVPGQSVLLEIPADRFGWLQVAKGSVSLGNTLLHAGDGVALTGPYREACVGNNGPFEALLFDLA